MSYDAWLSEERPGVLRFGGARMALLDIEAGFWGLRRQFEALVGPRLTDIVLQQAGVNGGASFARAFAGTDPAVDGERALRDCIAAYQAAGFGRFEIGEAEWPIGRVSIDGHDTFEAWMARRHAHNSKTAVCAYTAGVLVGFVNALTGRRDVVCVERTCQAQGAEHCRFELLPASAASDVPVVAMDPDPGLGRQLNLLEILFDRMPVGIAIFDADYYIRRYNLTWDDFARRYAPPMAIPLAPGVSYFGHFPGSEPIVIPLFERVLAGETIRQEALRFESGGIVSYWDVVLAPLVEDGQVRGILNVTTDATQRVQARQELEEALEAWQESQRRLSTLISNLPGMAYRCRNDVNWTMEFVSEGSLELTGYRADALIGNREIAYGELIHPDDRESVWEGVQTALRQDRPFQLTYRIVTPSGEKWVWEQGRGISARGGEIVALEGFVIDVTERVMAQRNLEQRVEERTRELSMLLNVSHAVSSTLELGPLLGLILDQAKAVVDYSGTAIMTLEDGDLVVRAYRGPIPEDRALRLRFPLEKALVNREVLRRRQVVIIPDVRGDTRHARQFQQTAGGELESTFGYVRSWLGAPLIAKGELLGMLTLDHSEPDYFTPRHAELIAAFANQVAVAIENARLFAHAEETAVAAERNRLARDLHDAVTQTLFSSSLIAEVLPRIWERNPEEGRRRLAELRELTRGALAEMRTLLLELRPSALIEANTSDLLRQLAESITGRARVPVHLEAEGECELDAEVKVALYRIAQEALNNVAKHAGATEATVRFQCQPGQVALAIRDDGLGFDPHGVAPDSLGLGIMRERAEAIGAELIIESQPGEGTQVSVVWTGDKGR